MWTKEALERLDGEFILGEKDPDNSEKTYLESCNQEAINHYCDKSGRLLDFYRGMSNHERAYDAITGGVFWQCTWWVEDMRKAIARIRGQSEAEAAKFKGEQVEYTYVEYFRKAYLRACKRQGVEPLTFIM